MTSRPSHWNDKDRLGLEILWPTDPQCWNEIEQDIVFVHGLTGGPISDWCDSNSGNVWPRDFLPWDLPKIRVMVFGYPVYQIEPGVNDLNESPGTVTVRRFGESLCSDLWDNRIKSDPAITLVGHGVGGIVIKKALCISHANQKKYGVIYNRTKHVLFLDTPHIGLNWTAWRAISNTKIDTAGPKNDCQWKLWSDALSDLTKTFNGISQGINITSAGADLLVGTGDSAQQIIPGNSSFTGLPHETCIHLDMTTHKTMCRFSDCEDSNYKRLSKRIKNGSKLLTRDPEQIQTLKTWLGGDLDERNDTEHDENLKRRHKGTCEWFLESEIFNKWIRNGSENPILWVTAPGGAGKSVLCSVVAKHVSNLKPKPASILVMITFDTERSRLQILKCLASQLIVYLHSQGGVDTDAFRFLTESSTKPANIQALVRFLVRLCPAVFFFLDGLNEVNSVEIATTTANRKQAEKFQRDLGDVVDFLKKLIADPEVKKTTEVRLWCSSQATKVVAGWMERSLTFQLDQSKIAKDVQSYLTDVIKRTIDEKLQEPADRWLTSQFMRARAGDNFRWAYMMEMSLERCAQNDQMMKKIFEGLPKDLRNLYQENLSLLWKLDDADEEEGCSMNLSRNILSILTFAKRPLSIKSLQEALSVVLLPLELEGCRNISNKNMIHLNIIKYRCTPLVDYISSSEADEGYLRLSHGSVYEFLTESMASEDSSESDSKIDSKTKTLVDPGVIAQACLKYLSQTRYSTLLQKHSADEFTAASGPQPMDVRKHNFLQYAAKYWYRHLEDIKPTSETCDQLKKFLLSPQFTTTIQVQSLFVVGHFIQNLEPKDGNRKCMKKNLPEWFRSRGGEFIMRGYESFLAEWGRFLQRGVTRNLNGELERCFWGALGSANFLQSNRNIEKYPSYRIAHDSQDYTRGRICTYETLNAEGTKLSLWTVVNRGDSSSSTHHLRRDAWYIDSRKAPIRYREETITFNSSLSNWSRYDPCRFHSYPLIPQLDSPERPLPIAIIQDSYRVRVGSSEFLRRSGKWQLSDDRSTLPYWENLYSRPPYTVKSRRRLAEEDSENNEGAPSSSRKYFCNRTRTPSVKSKHDTEDDEVNSTDASEREQSDISSDSDVASTAEHYISSASEVSHEDSTSDEFSGSDESDEISDLNDQGDIRSDHKGSSESTQSIDGSSQVSAFSGITDASSFPNSRQASVSLIAEKGEEWATESRLSPNARHSTNRSTTQKIFQWPTATDSRRKREDRSDLSDSDASSCSSNIGLLKGQPRISRRTGPLGVECDTCPDKNLLLYYRCMLCAPKQCFDICSRCFDRGIWCKDKGHQLRKMSYNFEKRKFTMREILSASHSKPGLYIKVQLQLPDEVHTVFQFSDPTERILYQSPPIIHPSKPLLVYPLDGLRFLFANLEDNTYFIHLMSLADTQMTRNGPSRVVSVQMRFSSCEKYLHVARIIGTKAENDQSTNLFCEVLIVQLAPKDMVSRRPRAVLCRGVSIGKWRQNFVSSLPFVLTWTFEHLYISISAERLQLFRFTLDCSSLLATSQRTETLDNEIVLPRSARNRPLYFFPQKKENSNAVLVIGCQHGDITDSPMVIYLSPQNLGDWKEADATLLSPGEDDVELRDEPLMEDFDSDSDCDLILYRNEFQ